MENGKDLIKYQIWHILHELVHYYVYATKQNALDIYNVNDCMLLPSKAALLNAMSYVYYAASKCMTNNLGFFDSAANSCVST